MNDSEILSIPKAWYGADNALHKCLRSSGLTFRSNPCQGRDYWMDYVWLTAAILFPRARLKFALVSFIYPQNLSNAADPSSEFGFVFSHPEALMTPLYFMRTAERMSWHPNTTFVGPFLFSPMAMLYRDDIFPIYRAIKWGNLLIHAQLTCLACFTCLLVWIAKGRDDNSNRVHVSVGGLLCAAILSLIDNYTVLLFTSSHYPVPIRDLDELARSAVVHDLSISAPTGTGRYLRGLTKPRHQNPSHPPPLPRSRAMRKGDGPGNVKCYENYLGTQARHRSGQNFALVEGKGPIILKILNSKV